MALAWIRVNLASSLSAAPPARRAGRHVRRTARQVITAAALSVAIVATLVVLLPGTIASVSIAVAVAGLTLGVCRVVAAHDADTDEERWLRQVLSDLRDPEEDEEDDDILVY
jgi:hypothetical protein